MALSAKQVESKKETGRYSDGNGLYLQVQVGSRGVTKSWLYRYKFRGRPRQMGLGSFPVVSLSMAREAALAAARVKAQGLDPIEHRQETEKEERAVRANSRTFNQCADDYIRTRRAGWKSDKHAAQWASTLKSYCGKVLGPLPVSQITSAHVIRVLRPIWEEKTETASRVRSRIELVLDAAKAAGFRSGENPARWKGNLDAVFAGRADVSPVEHHPALPYERMPTFLEKLRKQEGVAAIALEFLILTAARTGAAIGARWSEIDREQKVWRVPASRMKGRKGKPRPFRIPLSTRALEVLDSLPKADTDFLFPGGRIGNPLSNMALSAVLRRMQEKEVWKDAEERDIVVHGFRSSFRDWAGAATSHPSEVVKTALGHVIENKVDAAYFRDDLLDKRRVLMEEWAQHCTRVSAPNVHKLRKRA